ncbi:MAG TPA: filamentous hemagglutinin N-terminal domain-containing protein [Rhodocyclaceae bacterium]|nr:filamentous hemagglutinin N-terminal domain-containing protein [Rhodocyclaceae bacterium]
MTRQAQPVARPASQGNTFKFKTLSLAVAACLGSVAPAALANPTGAAVANGTATFATQGSTLTVTNSNGAIINWQQFNIGATETTRFVQPNAQSSVLNRVVGGDPSQILGTLQSNGQVFLINPNGIVFGRNSVIDVPGLIASTLNLSDADFLNRKFSFSGGGFGPLVNQGRITTPLGGSVMLIGSEVRNEGVITTPQGQVVLAAGNSVSLIDTAGPELSVTISATANKAVNLGEINAAGGRIDIFGALIEQQGILRADSASVDGQGRIILKATEGTTVSGTISATNSAGQGGSIQILGKDVTLTPSASLDASGATGGGQVLVGGDWQGKNPADANAQTTTMAAGAVIKADATDSGNGGKVVLWSDRSTDFKGAISARGGANGGNGGQVETSGHSLLLGGTVDTRAPKGAMGFWLLDPAAYCFDDFSSSCMMTPGATFVSTADVAQALQTSSVAYEATDFLRIYGLSLNNSSFTGGYVNQTGATLSFKAPYIEHYGNIAAANPLNVKMMATGTSATYSSFSGVIKSLGGVMTHGGELAMDASNHILFGSGTIDVNGMPGGYGDTGWERLWDIYLRAPAIVLDGKSVFANDLFMETNALKFGSMYPTTPLNGTIDSAAVVTYTPGTNIYVGMDQANAACASNLCVSTQLASPSLSLTHGVTLAAGRCNGGPNNCSFDTAFIDGDLVIGGFGGPMAVATSGDMDFIGKNVVLNSPLSTASSTSHILLLASNTFTNNVGANAIDTTNGGNWSVVIGNEAGSNLNGLSAPKYNMDLATLDSYDNNGNNWPTSNSIYILPASTPAPTVTDPCVLNPALCATNTPTTATADQAKTTTPVTTTGTATADASTLSGALTVDAKLTTSTTTATTTTVTQTTSTTQEAKLAVARKDAEKSVTEVQAEAKKAREDAGKAEAEAKRAEVEAKRAEAEAKEAEAGAKAAKTPAEKAAAKTRAEAKRAEAEEKKAQADAKQAEAEARKAEAEGREALAEAKVAPKAEAAAPVAAKQAQAESKQAQAEAKQAEAQARKADAESKQAAIEAREARNPDQKAVAQKTAEAKKIEAEAHKVEAQAKKVEAEAKQAEAEAKTAATPQARAAAEKRAESKRVEADVKKTEAEGKQAQAEGKLAEAQGKQAEVRAKEAQAEAKQAEAETRAAKTPEQKLAATQKAEVKKTEAEAHKTESEARKVEAEGKKIEAEAKRAEADVKKAEAEAKQAKAPEQRAAAERKAETKRTEAEVRKAEAEAKQTEAEAKQVQADAKMTEAEAKGTRSPGGRAVMEKEVQAKRAEGEHKLAEAAIKKAEAEVKKAEAVAKQAEAQGRKAESVARKAEAQAKKAEVEAKRAEVEKKRVEAEKKVQEHRIAVEKRREERRVETAKAFAAVVTAGANRAALENLAALRHELKTEALKPALNILKANPAAADLPPCGAGSTVCIPVAATQQSTALALPPAPVPKFAALPQIQRKVAVVIGVNKYDDPSIPSLESALPDAKSVGQQLQEQLGYDVRVVPDASRADIVTSLNKLSQEVGPNDSVTVYYAGHGYMSDKTKTGYWIPADAKVTSPDKWISNGDIGKLLSNIPAKQVMLVSDSCYSGSLTKEQKIVGATASFDPSGILAKRSVTVMSSGGEEPVSDEGKEGHSIFAYSFMNAMKSVKQVDSGAKLFQAVRDEVSKDFPQTPQYGGAVSAGHAPGGDYLLETRSYK